MNIEMTITDDNLEETKKDYKTPMKKLLYKKIYYKENSDRVKEYNLNCYYMKKYGRTREEIHGEKELNRKQKLELQLAKLKEKMAKLDKP